MSNTQHDISKLNPHRPVRPRRLRFSFSFLAIFITLTSQAKNGGWDLDPYHVQIAIAIDAPGGLAEQLANEPPHSLQRRIEASPAPAWTCDAHIATAAERAKILTTITAEDPAPADLPTEKDKLFIAVIRTAPDGIELTTREFDRYVQRWSSPLRRTSHQVSYLPEQLFSLLYQTFAPLAQLELDPKDPHRVLLKPRGSSLLRPMSTMPLAKPGDVYLPILRR